MSNINVFTAEQAIKYKAILQVDHRHDGMAPEEVEEIYDDLYDAGQLWDCISELREEGVETNLLAPGSRHYETEQRAMNTPLGWVAYTYWYGGGKHSNPEEIEWMAHAYFVDVEEKEVTVTVTQRTFTKKGNN